MIFCKIKKYEFNLTFIYCIFIGFQIVLSAFIHIEEQKFWRFYVSDFKIPINVFQTIVFQTKKEIVVKTSKLTFITMYICITRITSFITVSSYSVTYSVVETETTTGVGTIQTKFPIITRWRYKCIQRKWVISMFTTI